MKRHIEEEADSAMVPQWQGFLKKNLELRIKSSDAVLKNQILATDGIELPTSSEKEWINNTTSNNSFSGCAWSIISYRNPPFLQMFTFSHPWANK